MPHRSLSRRELLQVGGISLLGLSLPRLLRADEARNNRSRSRADACILIFLNGGPSHLDMWDMKPDAPAEIRGEFKPIATSVPGVQLSEHLPRLARLMHHCTLVRSVHHSVNNAHAAAVYAGLTGHDRGEIGGGTRPTDYPAIGSVVGLCRPPRHGGRAVRVDALHHRRRAPAARRSRASSAAGWAGPTIPLFVLRDPNAAGFGMPELAPAADVNAARLDARNGCSIGIGRGPRPNRAPAAGDGRLPGRRRSTC